MKNLHLIHSPIELSCILGSERNQNLCNSLTLDQSYHQLTYSLALDSSFCLDSSDNVVLNYNIINKEEVTRFWTSYLCILLSNLNKIPIIAGNQE